MISRVAASCFWLTRHFERIDTWSRLLEVNSGFSLDVDLKGADRWRPLIVVIGQEEDFLERIGVDSIEDGEVVQSYLVWDERNPLSLYSSARAVRENARTIREVMTVEMWETVNDFWLWLGSRSAKRLYDRERDAFYKRLSAQCMMFHGICYSTMLHDDPFTFMKLGRALERVGQTARVLDMRYQDLGDRGGEQESPLDAVQWLAILRSCSASEPFFKRASNVLSGSAVTRFMLFDRTFPRSVLHNLDRARGLLLRLLEEDAPMGRSPSWEALERFRGSLLQMDIEDVQHRGVHETLTWVVDESAKLCDAILDEFVEPSRESLREQVKNDAALAASNA